jgi:hypothetical protein
MLLGSHKCVDCASVEHIFASARGTQNRKAVSRVRLVLFKALVDELSYRNVRLGLSSKFEDVAQAYFAVIAITDLASAGITSGHCLLSHLNFPLALEHFCMKRSSV